MRHLINKDKINAMVHRLTFLSVLFIIALLWMVVPVHAQTFKVGWFTKIGTTGTQPVAHGLGETRKALILWTNGKTNETASASFLFGFGVTDQTGTSCSGAASSQNGVTTPNASPRLASKALTIVQWGEATLAEADVTSWDATNFTLNWTTNNATAYVVHFIAIGGSDVSSKVVTWTMPNAAGNRSVTGVGFRPDLVINGHIGDDFTAGPGWGTQSAHFGLGVMDSAGNQWATDVFSLDKIAVGNTDTQRGQQTNGCIYAFNNSLTVTQKTSFVSMDSDGFTVNFSTANANAGYVFSLGLKGPYVKAGNFNKTTTTPAPVSQSITGVGFQPSAVLLASFQDITQAAPQANTRFGLGAGDGTSQGSSALNDRDAVATSSVQGIDKTSKVFMKVNNNTSTINAEANLTSMDANGFTLSWTVNDAVATQMLYLALGSKQCAFAYRKSITVQAGQVSGGPHIDFPMLVNITDTDLRTKANGGSVASANGYDIIFRASDGRTGLPHEIERYNGTSGELIAWVKVPSLDNGTVIYMYYGNSCITSSTENINEVWNSNFIVVQHMHRASYTELDDSTGNHNDVTSQVDAPTYL